eukprot:ANDGO_00225.mRNA.1 Neutral ceramidase
MKMNRSVFAIVVLASIALGVCSGAEQKASRRASVSDVQSKLMNSATNGSPLTVGVSKVDGSLPVGVPLAGYSERHTKDWPLPNKTAYTTFMIPSVGIRDPTWVRALVLDDGASGRFMIVTIDAIGADGGLVKKAIEIAAAQGLKTNPDHVIVSASHSHSGPGAVSYEKLWELAPATDLIVPAIQVQLASSMASAMIAAEAAMEPAVIALTTTTLAGYTRNRRAHIAHYPETYVDTTLGVIRVDSVTGTPLATLWNFACHGTCFGPSNLLLSGDIVGHTSTLIEQAIGVIGHAALFVQADAGDVSPNADACAGLPDFAGSHVFAQTVLDTRTALQSSLSSDVSIAVASQVVSFGDANLNFTFTRWENCTQGGPLDICGICKVLRCDVPLRLDSSWIENTPRFTAVRLDIAGHHFGLVTVPGEALTELGLAIRSEMALLGFERTIFAGYSNSHMGYFAPPDQYDLGGYESQLTFFTRNTAWTVRDSAIGVAKLVAPQS